MINNAFYFIWKLWDVPYPHRWVAIVFDKGHLNMNHIKTFKILDKIKLESGKEDLDFNTEIKSVFGRL